MSFKIYINESNNKRFSVRDANKSFFDYYLDDLKQEGADENEIKRRAAENFIGQLIRHISEKYGYDVAHYEAMPRKNDPQIFDVEASTDKHEITGYLYVKDNYTINYKKSTLFIDSEDWDKVKQL
jgi:hypothetical protein